MASSHVLLHERLVKLDRCPADLAQLRIAHVSDLHFHRWSRAAGEAQDLLCNADVDFLAMTGDFGDFRRRWSRAADLSRRFFEPLAKRLPIYAVLGNHDDPRMADALGDIITFLNNRSVTATFHRTTIELAGLDQNVPGAENLQAALGHKRLAPCSILLAHYPSTLRRLPPGRVDLVLSGHTHGGQIRLPWLGCLWPNDRIPRAWARGLHHTDRGALHVSAGIGASLPVRIRLNCPPELSILTLEAATPGSGPRGQTSPRRSLELAVIAGG